MRVKRRFRVLASCVLWTAALQAPMAHAQDASGERHEQNDPPRNSISISGIATIANASLRGVTSDRQLFLFGVRYNRLIFHNQQISLLFTSEAIPLALLREPFFIGTNIQSLNAIPTLTESRTTYGVGASPLGLELGFLTQKKFQPFIGLQGGFLYFDRNVLSAGAAQFNFTLDGRAGARMKMGDGKFVSLAYMFEHISNAYTALENPGLDAHMITVDYTFPLRHKAH